MKKFILLGLVAYTFFNFGRGVELALVSEGLFQ